ncbi:MAG: ABC transporter substrate-binding protein [Candidatus Promineifilaceae bacterium]|nr:ABC transporter substrate-binding protein [Candidatus Promineifilaceae bacterium]
MLEGTTDQLKLRLLGSFSLTWSDDKPCPLNGTKSRALLAVLATQPDRRWPREDLIALLWPDADTRAGGAGLRQALYHLRKAVTSPAAAGAAPEAAVLLHTSRESVGINPAASLAVDLIQMRGLLAEVRSHGHNTFSGCSSCLHKLEAAVALYRGDFLADLLLTGNAPFAQWTAEIRAAVRQDLLEALEELAQAYLERGRMDEAQEKARRLLEIEPLRESAQQQLMLILARSGQREEALAQFEKFRRLLAREQEVSPAAETVELRQLIWEGKLESAIAPGAKLRSYLIMEEVGSGAFGNIYRAWHPALDREVAIKVILPQFAAAPEFIERFEHEARLVAALEHPFIVPLYDYWRDAGGTYLVMRYFESDLNRYLEKKSLTDMQVRRFLNQLADALFTVHEEGVVHRDIKPFNILIDEKINFYLTDFGIAQDRRHADPALTPVGTSTYTAPELLNNQPATPQSDIYSLGILLYELLTGEPPFIGVGRSAAGQHPHPLPSLHEKRPDLPLAVDLVLQKATHPEPNNRFTDTLALAVAFSRALGEAQEVEDEEKDMADLAPGRRIREYEVREKFASGAFSTIYRAYQTAVRREVAMKVILPKFADIPEFMSRWEAEAHIVARMEHPHIVPLYDYWRDAGGIYLIMRLLRGGNLRSRVERGPLPPGEIFFILSQVVSALDAVHQHGIVHRDLKPSNILLDEQGNAYLSDFGIAKDLEVDAYETHPGTFIGSPAYMSPEQLLNATVTRQSDIYSLGIILFELLTGRHPFETDNLAPLIQKHLSEPLPSLLENYQHLPVAVDWVLSRATAKQPEARYRDALSFLEDFERALGGVTVEGGRDRFISAVESTIERSMDRSAEPPAAAGAAPAAYPSPAAMAAPFVGRERQLKRLASYLDQVVAGEGHMVFVTGGAGRGKTSLLDQFTRQALAGHEQVLVARGVCHMTGAEGDPYLPFRELLGMLTGDVDVRLRAGRISGEHARRLQEALPVVGQAIVEQGPELIDALIPGRDLFARSRASLPKGAGWLDQLLELGAVGGSSFALTERKRLFSHFTAVLHEVAQSRPLILILDDLQWIDSASAALLFHLSRSLRGHPILIAGAYRREEVALGREDKRHPLEKLLSESKRTFGDIWINLAELPEAEELHFVNTLLDQEPNRFSANFRHALYDHTQGHALFTVELLRAMQERGDLLQDEKGRWYESDSLDWEELPWRIEGVIEERTNRLDEEQRSLLSTAAVEGEQFTAEVLARVHDQEPAWVMGLLSRQLQKRHFLVREQGEQRAGQSFLTRYRFSHHLIQQYLLNRLSAGEKRLLHAEIAPALEELVGEHWRPHAAILAWHYQQAGLPEKALPFWLWLGDQARAVYAHAEAERSYQRAIEVAREMGNLELAGRTALKLALVYTADFQPQKAQDTYQQAFAWWDPARDQLAGADDTLPRVTMRLALEAPNTLDPGLISDDASTFLAAQLFEGLVHIGQEHTVMPALAQRWELLDNGRRYRFHIRPDARWNDGQPLTAKHFEFAIRRNLHPDTASPSAHLLFVLKNARAYAAGELAHEADLGVRTLDPYTLELILEQPTAYVPHLMAHTVTFPLPEHALQAAQGQWTAPQNLVSNGPYQLERVEDDRHWLLSRNPHYAGTFRGNVERVKCTIIDDYQPVLRQFKQGKFDAVNLRQAGPEIVSQARQTFGDSVLLIPRWSTLYLSFRCDKPPFNDRRVRQALAMALDRAALTERGFQGLRLAADGGFVPPGMPGHSPGIALPYDPAKARALLVRAGYPGGRGFLPVEWAASPGGDQVLSFIRHAWQENLGLSIQPARLDWEVFMARLNDDPAHLTLLGWGADIPDPQNMLLATFHSQEGFNMPRWQNQQFDDLTAAAESVIDHERRMALYQQADRILVAKETAVLPLCYDQGRFLVEPWVRFPSSPMFAMPLRLVTVARPAEEDS